MQSFLQRAGKRLLSAESLCELLGSGESRSRKLQPAENPGAIFKHRHSFCPQGQRFHDLDKAFFRIRSHENYVTTSQPCRITTEVEWGLGTRLGFGPCFGSGFGGIIFKHAGVIFKHRHTFGRQEPYLHNVDNAFFHMKTSILTLRLPQKKDKR